jgi:hypothetical protein
VQKLGEEVGNMMGVLQMDEETVDYDRGKEVSFLEKKLADQSRELQTAN